eukprot:4110177-Pleurochrysis_carterae.AAC.1
MEAGNTGTARMRSLLFYHEMNEEERKRSFEFSCLMAQAAPWVIIRNVNPICEQFYLKQWLENDDHTRAAQHQSSSLTLNFIQVAAVGEQEVCSGGPRARGHLDCHWRAGHPAVQQQPLVGRASRKWPGTGQGGDEWGHLGGAEAAARWCRTNRLPYTHTYNEISGEQRE